MENKLIALSASVLCVVSGLTFAVHHFGAQSREPNPEINGPYLASDLAPAPYPTEQITREMLRVFEEEQNQGALFLTEEGGGQGMMMES
jgi:hypothetical protein